MRPAHGSLNFTQRLARAQRQAGSLLCVGLDIDPRRLPNGVEPDRRGIELFIRGIIEATADLVCAYKPNLAFFEAMGDMGYALLRTALEAIPPGIISIADGKRGDIGTTAERYATAIFDVYGFDAATVNPYQGTDSVAPYLQDESRGAFLLCKTSNPGSADFQDLLCLNGSSPEPLFEIVARRAVEWNTRGNVGLVVGATYPSQLARVRELAPDLPILIPGVGPQGGDASTAARLGSRADGTLAVVAASRQVIAASHGPDWKEAARRAACALRDAMTITTADA